MKTAARLLAIAVALLLAGATLAQPDTQPGAALAPASAPAGSVAGLSYSGANVAIIPISDHVYDFTAENLEERCNQAIAEGATVIVIELDVPGGYADDAIKISTFLKKLKVPTIAWVHDRANHAGALIATACRSIVMSPHASIGPCDEQDKDRAKFIGELYDNAKKNGYDLAILQAISTPGVELYQVRNRASGQVRLVNQLDYRVMVGDEDPDTVKPAIGDKSEIALTLGTVAERGKWELVRKLPIAAPSVPLTLYANDALTVGLARDITVTKEADLKTLVGAAKVSAFQGTALQGVAHYLSQGWVRGLLIVIFFICVAIEMHAPHGIAGTIAAFALVLLLGAPFIVGIAQIWHVILVFIGFALLVVEVVWLPGHGSLAVLGVLLMFIGLVLAVVPTPNTGAFSLPNRDMWGELQLSVVWTTLGFLGSVAGFAALTRYLGTIPVLNRLVLRRTEEDEGLSAAGRQTPVSGGEVIGSGRVAVGHTGTVVAELRPTGRARIDGDIIDVMSTGGWVGAGQRVRVVEVRGNLIIVEAEVL